MINDICINSKEQLDPQMDHLRRRLHAFWNFESNKLKISFDIWKERRSLNQNALYWEWMGRMAEHYSRGGNGFTKDDMHDLMRHLFLGYETRVIGSTELQPQLKSTTQLSRAGMSGYMNQIDAWNIDKGLLLPVPADNEYAKYREASV